VTLSPLPLERGAWPVGVLPDAIVSKRLEQLIAQIIRRERGVWWLTLGARCGSQRGVSGRYKE